MMDLIEGRILPRFQRRESRRFSAKLAWIRAEETATDLEGLDFKPQGFSARNLRRSGIRRPSAVPLHVASIKRGDRGHRLSPPHSVGRIRPLADVTVSPRFLVNTESNSAYQPNLPNQDVGGVPCSSQALVFARTGASERQKTWKNSHYFRKIR